MRSIPTNVRRLRLPSGPLARSTGLDCAVPVGRRSHLGGWRGYLLFGFSKSQGIYIRRARALSCQGASKTGRSPERNRPKGAIMARRNAFYAQSGGVSAVINASACGVLETARQHSGRIANVYAGRNGIIGALTEDLIDTSVETEAAIAALKHTPGVAFGSCRYKLGSIYEHRAQYERLIIPGPARGFAPFTT